MVDGQNSQDSSDKIIVVKSSFQASEEYIDPPPPGLTSKFDSVDKWLLALCKDEKPLKRIAQYTFGLFESPNRYTIYLVGENTYETGEYSSKTLIEFEPTNTYFILPEKYFIGLNRDQLIQKITDKLKSFVKREEFLNSFFAEAKAVVFSSNRQLIWAPK